MVQGSREVWIRGSTTDLYTVHCIGKSRWSLVGNTGKPIRLKHTDSMLTSSHVDQRGRMTRPETRPLPSRLGSTCILAEMRHAEVLRGND
jgi:hypothetical protein